MYREFGSDDLLAGDVIKLKLEDFKRLAKHKSILAIFREFYKTPTFKHGHWAILNKPCDMIECSDTKKKRIFETNLLLCPLRSLKSALREGILKGYLDKGLESPQVAFRRLFEDYLRNKRVADTEVLLIIGTIEHLIEPFMNDTVDPYDFAGALCEFTKDSPVYNKYVLEFSTQKAWKTYSEKYMASVGNRDKLMVNKDGTKKLSNLCLNQMDSQGLFFFEPHPHLSSMKHDLCFLIKLDEMISFKINPKLISSGEVSSFLKTKRILGLRENFSDRLLNIIGNYYSKIGTSDVQWQPIWQLYRDLGESELACDLK